MLRNVKLSRLIWDDGMEGSDDRNVGSYSEFIIEDYLDKALPIYCSLIV